MQIEEECKCDCVVHVVSLDFDCTYYLCQRKCRRKNIVIDVSHIKSKPAKLVADYDSDFNELVAQLIELDPDSQLLKSQFESGKSSPEIKRIELLAKNFLESRYENNKTNLRPEILAAAESNKMQLDTLVQPLSYDLVQYEFGDKTRTTGNYGSTSGDGSYSAAAYNNFSKAYAYSLLAFAQSSAQSGWQFMAGIGYPNETFDADLKFRYVTFKDPLPVADLELKQPQQLKLGHGSMTLLRIILLVREGVGATYCTAPDYIQIADFGPMSMTYTGVHFRNSHVYNAYIETTALSTIGGVASAKANDYGAKWEYIEVLNFKNPKP